jgi:hypothetical protein
MDRALVVVGLCALIAVVALLIRRRSPGAPERIEPADVGLTGSGTRVVGFSSPYCLPCQAWEDQLARVGLDFVKVDVSERPDRARRYAVRTTPLILAVELPGGRVIEAYRDEPEPGQVERLAAFTRP